MSHWEKEQRQFQFLGGSGGVGGGGGGGGALDCFNGLMAEGRGTHVFPQLFFYIAPIVYMGAPSWI